MRRRTQKESASFHAQAGAGTTKPAVWDGELQVTVGHDGYLRVKRERALTGVVLNNPLEVDFLIRTLQFARSYVKART